MPNIATVLREEICRLARKEARALVGPVKQRNAELRHSVAALKRDNADLQRRLAFLELRERERLDAPPETAGENAKEIRFSPAWVRKDRRRLGLSAKDYARLVGVTPLTIYNWEHERSRPRAKALAAWAEIRGLGKREAVRRLELLES